jgi:Inner membrane protein involved in colicin E2 resistance
METQKETSLLKNKSVLLTLKALMVFVLILVLLIPMAFVHELLVERQERQEEVREEVSQKWAGDQKLTGPILILPYRGEAVRDQNGQITGYETAQLYILPRELNIEGNITPHLRHRSIFDVTVYQADLQISGSFDVPDLVKIPQEAFYPEEACLFFGLDDFRGLEAQLKIQWGEDSLEFAAGSHSHNFKENGLYAPLNLPLQALLQERNFSMNLNIKGSETLAFTPVGKTNHTKIRSVWDKPSFVGYFLPDTPAQMTKEGFEAEWNILYLNRNYPQVWKDQTYSFSGSRYGVNLLQEVDSYAKTLRAQKYAILFIALSFALYFFIEILQKRKIHPVQYVLVGVALCVFYVLLLSLSEYLHFNLSYALAALATIGLISLYTRSAFHSSKIALVFGAVLSSLYGFIFILIQLEDKALLFGSLGLFAILAVVMYGSRKIEWYG